MATESNFKHGGRRANAGRKKDPNSKVQIALKLDRDLSDVFNSSRFVEGNMLRGQYINIAIRGKMQEDGLLSADDDRTEV